MFDRQLCSSIALSLAVTMAGAGCVMNKKKQTAVTEEAPPAAAYPAGENAPAGAGSASSPAASGYADSASANSTAQAPSSSRKYTPPPFELLSNEQLVIYQVGSGDTLGVIAKKYKTTTSRIMAANGMRNTKIYAGKAIKVPTLLASRESNENVASIYTTSPATPSTQTAPPVVSSAPAAQTYPSSGNSGTSTGGYTGTTATGPAATPSYVGPATSGNPGLPSVSTSGAYSGTTTSQEVRKTKPVQPAATATAPKPVPATSSAAFPTPSFSSGN